MTSLRPQPGKQEMFLSSPADIAIYGGAAGGGKSYGLLLETLRHIGNPDFGAVVFRRLSTQITNEGGLWDNSKVMFAPLGAIPSSQPRHMWRFPGGAKVSFAHLQYEMDVLQWQGAQIPLIVYDELTHFTKYQFFYMLSRNRSTCGVRPYVRASTNPDSDSWVAEFIAWWIDQETGLPIPERAGLIRYFTRIGEEVIWGDSREEVAEKAGFAGPEGLDLVKSLTFIPSTLDDNPILLSKDPAYRANLMAMPRVERERLLGGNWKVKPSGGAYFPMGMAEILPAIPSDVMTWVRRWDLAATEPSETNRSPDATAGVLMGKRADGRIVIADVRHMRAAAAKVRLAVKNAADQDRVALRRVTTIVPQDPGQAGKEQAQQYATLLSGHLVRVERERGKKDIRAEPLAAQWQVGNVALVKGDWNRAFLAEMDSFPGGDHDDMVDAASGAYAHLVGNQSAEERFKAMA